MFELILLFAVICFVLYGEIKDDEEVIECKTHNWSKDINTSELVCMTCNFRSGK